MSSSKDSSKPFIGSRLERLGDQVNQRRNGSLPAFGFDRILRRRHRGFGGLEVSFSYGYSLSGGNGFHGRNESAGRRVIRGANSAGGGEFPDQRPAFSSAIHPRAGVDQETCRGDK